jgi:hypothetical protein
VGSKVEKVEPPGRGQEGLESLRVIVKGIRMPARRRREGMHGGRRPKSLEGGNRGGVQTAGEFVTAVVSIYGDLAPVLDLICRLQTGTGVE